MNILALPTARIPKQKLQIKYLIFGMISIELRRMKWQLKRKAEDELEKVFLREALKRNKGNISKTVLDVGMDRRQLQNLIRKHRIVPKEFKGGSQ